MSDYEYKPPPHGLQELDRQAGRIVAAARRIVPTRDPDGRVGAGEWQVLATEIRTLDRMESNNARHHRAVIAARRKVPTHLFDTPGSKRTLCGLDTSLGGWRYYVERWRSNGQVICADCDKAQAALPPPDVPSWLTGVGLP